jgi:glucose-1-phosphate adenylyltransferase
MSAARIAAAAGTEGARPEMLAVILGGGRGTRLYPLTRYRSKPAVPLAGKYRLIDVPLSNCIHSGIRRIYVLTQFLSASLNRHISSTYRFDQFAEGFVEILAAEQTLDTELWFQGTADAVRQSLRHIVSAQGTHVLILAGDALYRQDFNAMLDEHTAARAEITVSCKLVGGDEAPQLGILGIDADRRVARFCEKPPASELAALAADPAVLEHCGCHAEGKPYLASMGTYLFNKDVLLDVLAGNTHHDFGKQVIPEAIASRRVHAHLFDGYWEDIGSIRSFFRANLDLLDDNPQFDFYDAAAPIFTRSRILPSSEVVDSRLHRAMVAEGCLIRRAEIRNSVLGIRTVVSEGAQIENSVVMGADFYDAARTGGRLLDGQPALGIGRNVTVRNAIIDKNARIGEGVRILNHDAANRLDADTHSIRDGIVIIPKNAVLPPGTVI